LPEGTVLTALLRLRSRLQQRFRFSTDHSMLLWAALCGLLGALATVAFRSGIRLLEQLISGRSDSLVAIAEGLPSSLRVLIPTCGGLVAGTFLVLASRIPSSTSSDYMEAVVIGEGRIPVRVSLLRSLSSLFTIATGGSIGREGSMVQLAAMVSATLGRVWRFEPAQLRLLIACGAAAGLTSAYSAPIAGALFVTEILIGSISMGSFGPILMASVVANITMQQLPGYQPPYVMPEFPLIHGLDFVFFTGLGVLCGLVSPLFLRLLALARSTFKRSAMALPLRLSVGGLLVGLISLWEPQVWGNGYSVVNSILHSQWAWTAVATVLVLKIVATAITTGSGAVGGVFTPTLFVGAAFGFLFGSMVHALMPSSSIEPFAYAMVGMGAFLAAATSAPIMAILMISEMTVNYQVMAPLMLSCVVAYFVARAIDHSSMYEITATRLRNASNQTRVRETRMRDLVRPAQTVLARDAPFTEVTRMFLAHPVKYIYIVDRDQAYLGVVSLQDVNSILLGATPSIGKSVEELLRRDAVPELAPDMTMGEALDLFLAHPGERLPTVDRDQHSKLLGVVYKSQLLEAYGRLEGLGV
jgi:CIC family chloride channel protein